MTIDLLFAPVYRNGGEFYSYLPGISYNFFLTDPDVGDDGRLEVLAINAGLMLGGHLFYKTFIQDKNKQPEIEEKAKAFRVIPIVTTDYQGLMATYRF